MKKHNLLYFILFIYNLSFSQNDSTELKYILLNNIIKLPKIVKYIEKKDTCSECLKPYGKKFKINLALDKWKKEITDSSIIYSIEIQAPSAKYLDIFMKDLYISENSVFRVYNSDNNYLEFNKIFNLYNDKYKVITLSAEKVILQYIIPNNIEVNNNIELSSIVYIYDKDMFIPQSILKSLSCQIDVNCSEGNQYREIIRSIVLIRNLCKNNGDCYRCSGSLLNNTNLDYEPYILTAHHCINNSIEDNLDNTIFSFNWQCSICNGTVPYEGSLDPYKIIGAKLKSKRSSTTGSDFALLKLNQNIPLYFNVFYAGWSRERNLTGSDVVGIHHPHGYPKKISFGHIKGISLADYLNVEWDNGTVEDGSSGSPVFKNKYVVGQLSGGLGNNSCSNLGDDLYGHFASSWGSSWGKKKRLKDWLDPRKQNPDKFGGVAPSNLCIPELNLSGIFPRTDYQSESVILHAENSINLSNINIQENGNFSFKAGKEIVVKSNSVFKKGSLVKLQIEPCFSNKSVINYSLFQNTFNDSISNKEDKYYKSETVDNFSDSNYHIKLFPNPGEGIYYLLNYNNLQTIKKIEIYNIIGKKLKTLNNSNDFNFIDISDFSNGVYILKFFVDDYFCLFYKIIKQ